MTKEEVVKLLVLIESTYPRCIFKDETVQQWLQFCSDMDYERVMARLKNHIRRSPFPPAMADIAVWSFEQNEFPETLQEWIKKGRERIECQHNQIKRIPIPDWLVEYSTRKPV